jgi:hypothetical protein
MSPPVEEEMPGQFWKDFIAAALPTFRGTPFEQLESYVLPVWEAIVDSSLYVEQELRGVLAEIGPDLVCIDNVILFPAAVQAGCPWVRIVSCNEAEIRDPAVPPYLSGLPAGDRSEWAAFEAEERRLLAPLSERFNAFLQDRGLPPYPVATFFEPSPYLNLLLYPRPLAYAREPARARARVSAVRIHSSVTRGCSRKGTWAASATGTSAPRHLTASSMCPSSGTAGSCMPQRTIVGGGSGSGSGRCPASACRCRTCTSWPPAT